MGKGSYNQVVQRPDWLISDERVKVWWGQRVITCATPIPVNSKPHKTINCSVIINAYYFPFLANSVPSLARSVYVGLWISIFLNGAGYNMLAAEFETHSL